MMPRLGVAFAAAAICLAAPARVSRAQLKAVEVSFDQRISRANIDDPYDLLGATRAVYVDGFGVVFSTEVNLVVGPAITPFRPKLSADEVEKLRARKLARLPQWKQLMKDMLLTAATSLTTMPPDEQVVVGTHFFFYSWEDRKELPEQLVLKATRKTLLEVEAGRARLDSVVQEQAF